jgi:hypothetical protein
MDVMDHTGKVIAQQPLQSDMTVNVPAMGLVVLRLPHVEAMPINQTQQLPILKQGHVVMELAEPWQQVHAFRIRSPFGHDGLYVVLMGHPAEGATAKLVFDSKSPSNAEMTSTGFPHEFLQYPIDMTQDISFHLRLTDANGKTTDTSIMTLFGRDGEPVQ